MANNRKPVPAGGQPTPATIASADTTPLAGGAAGDVAGENAGNAPPDDGAAVAPSDNAPSEPAPAAAGTDNDDEIIEARVLVAFDDYQPDDIVTDFASAIEQLKLSGRADPHPDAVAFARSLVA